MPFLSDLRQEITEGKKVRRAGWPAHWHLVRFDIKDSGNKIVGSVLTVFYPNPDDRNKFLCKQYTPTWPEIVGDDWELYNQ